MKCCRISRLDFFLTFLGSPIRIYFMGRSSLLRKVRFKSLLYVNMAVVMQWSEKTQVSEVTSVTTKQLLIYWGKRSCQWENPSNLRLFWLQYFRCFILLREKGYVLRKHWFTLIVFLLVLLFTWTKISPNIFSIFRLRKHLKSRLCLALKNLCNWDERKSGIEYIIGA